MTTETRQNLDTLYAAERLAGWKPAALRADADALEAGTHDLAALLPDDARAATVTAMRAEADAITAAGAAATEALALARANTPDLPWVYKA